MIHCYDFWILCMGEKEQQTDINTNIHIEKLSGDKLYGAGVFMNDIEGTCYSLLKHKNEVAGTTIIEENKSTVNYFNFPWMEFEEKEDIKSIYIKNEYIDDVKVILEYFMKKSPCKRLLVSIRCQGLEKQNIIGSLTVND